MTRVAAILLLLCSLSATADEKNQWPRFRGPGGNGVSPHTNLTLDFDVKTGKGIRWKTAIPLPGKNSPIVWGDWVFLSGATQDKQAVYCFDARSGKIRWQASVPMPAARPAKWTKPMKDTGWAAPTLATDGKRVCAVFASGALVAYDLDGKPLWSRHLGWPRNGYGHSASLLIWRDRLLIQLDQSKASLKQSKLIAIDTKSGKQLYSVTRPVGASWSSPIIARTAKGDQLITCSNPWVIAYDPQTGREIWRANCLEGDGGPSPTFAGGFVLAMNVDSYLSAIRPDGKGDVTKTHIAWQVEDGLSDIASHVASDKRVFLLDTGGLLTCYDLTSHKKLYEKELDEMFIASPTLIGARLLLVQKNGRVLTLPSFGKGKQTIGELRETCEASPAFADGTIFFRGHKQLICVGQKK
ncbi:PQQ-binding-like beta-propeller repeat protein [bacterium AH-315-M10]|nr:PQQ-binding-like beta-propeller repeat protein [bacterium AH-315-M10]